MRTRLLAALFAVCLCAAAQTSLTVAQLVAFVKSSVTELKHRDDQVAKFLRGVRLTQRLDDHTIEDLQGIGAGPKTLEALRTLRDQSKSLAVAEVMPPAPPPTPIPPPSMEEQGKIIEEVRENALNYTKNLPDFICTQVTRRFVDPRGGDSFQPSDTLTARLSYFEQKEDYKLILHNDRVTNEDYRNVGGASSTGEFGSMMREIFELRTHTRFDWDHWGLLRKRMVYVFAYQVPQAYSQWHITYEKKLDIVPGYRGLIYVDKETKMVTRLILEAIDIPASFPVQAAKTQLDYDYGKVGDQDFLLPLRAEIRMHADRYATKNETEFRLYRKFSAEAQISYDTPAALGEEQTKEQPVQTPVRPAPAPVPVPAPPPAPKNEPGLISGTLTDPRGIVLSGVEVKLTADGNPASRMTKTNQQGYFSFADLPPATYTLSVSAPGFQPYSRRGITITASQQRAMGNLRIDRKQ